MGRFVEIAQMDGQAKNPETSQAYLDRRVLIVGAARSGRAAAEFLLSRGAHVILTDSRSQGDLGEALEPVKKLALSSGELTLELGGHNPESFGNCDFVVVSPGVPLALPILEMSRAAGIPVMAEVELASRHLRGKILGITGSNGKTTTTALVTELLRGSGLKGHSAGNIGIPLIGYASTSSPDDLYATELSSFQLEGILQMRPWVSSLLNLTPDHLDRYSGFEAYIAAKRRIYMNQEKEDYAVLNADDPRTLSSAAEVRSVPVLFSRRGPVDHGTLVRNGDLFWRDGNRERWLFGREDIRLKGAHNLENVLAACAIAVLAGARPEAMREVVQNFKGVEHRIEWVAEIDGVQYFNDSKATNVDATIKSLESFPGGIHLIAGGKDKGGDFSALRDLVRDRVKHLALIGEATGKIREALSDLVETTEEASLETAVVRCRAHAIPGDVVLLAPACASFDMFEDYEHRGRVFKKVVTAMRERS